MTDFPCNGCRQNYHCEGYPCYWNANCSKYQQWLKFIYKGARKMTKELLNYDELMERLRAGEDAGDIASKITDTINLAMGEYKRELNKAKIEEEKKKFSNTIYKDIMDYITLYYPVEYEDGLFDFIDDMKPNTFYEILEAFIEYFIGVSKLTNSDNNNELIKYINKILEKSE